MSIVVIPAYKPDQTLVSITDKLWEYGCRIIVVDDGSGKEYQQVFEKIKDICIVLCHTENRGKGAAIKTALSYIKREIWGNELIGIMDCDGQHLPEDMHKLFQFAETRRKALVLGVRKVGKEMPLKSRLGNQITRIVYRLITGVKVSDTQTGLRVFDSELTEKLLSVKGERYEYEMNVLIACAKAKIPIEEMQIRTIYRDKDNSNSHFRGFRDSIRIYKEILKFTLSSFSGFILDYLLFSLLMFFLPHTAVAILLANIGARVVSAFYNYSVNCRFVFHTAQRIREAAGYFALAGFVLIMNNLILELLVQLFRIPVHPAKLLTECLLFAISWLVQKHVIFGKKKCLTVHFRINKRAKGFSGRRTATYTFTGRKVKA